MGRFDYVKYDEVAVEIQAKGKDLVIQIEELIGREASGTTDETAAIASAVNRSKEIALAKLEEFYMWFGKSIRDDQIGRNCSAPLQENRKDG